MDRQIDGQMDRRTDGQKYIGETDGHMDRWTKEQIKIWRIKDDAPLW
jgi:hypothetical protein